MTQFKEGIDLYFQRLKNVIDNMDQDRIELFLNKMIEAYDNNKNIFIMGNGGSAITASHFACDINKGVYCGPDRGFKVICLSDSLPTILAYANDLSYDRIFVEQLKNFLNEGDMVIGISGSGNSRNVLLAIEYAKSKNAYTVGWCGYDGGELKKKVDLDITTHVDDMQLSEDIHLVLVHIAMQQLIKKFKER